jgi:hypothetical protein
MAAGITVSILCLAGALFCGRFLLALIGKGKPVAVYYLIRERGIVLGHRAAVRGASRTAVPRERAA